MRVRGCRLFLVIGVLSLPVVSAELPSAISIQVGENGSLVTPWAPGEPTVATGGFTATCDGVTLGCDHLSVIIDQLPGTAIKAVREGSFFAGPEGPTPERVLLDSRASTAPTVGFRGVLTPTAMTILRPADAARPGRAVFRIDLQQVGTFSGRLLMEGEWTPISGWCHQARIEAEGDVTATGIERFRTRSITLSYRPEGAGQERRMAELNRFAPTANDDQMKDPANGVARIDGKEIAVVFDDLGRPSFANKGTRISGDLNFFGAGAHKDAH